MSKFCSRCGTENDDSYAYCKNCGKAFSPAYVQNPPPEPTNDFDGIKYNEMAEFAGANSYTVLKKLSRMQIAQSKVSWCWPVAILGLLFGPLGAAIWFFYRKMYKWAFALLGIGAVLGAATALLNKDAYFLLFDEFKAIYNAASDGTLSTQSQRYMNELNDIMQNITALRGVMIASAVNDITRFATTVLLGAFSMNIYKNHAAGKINAYKSGRTQKSPYVSGGTSGAMAFLGVVFLFVINSITGFIPFIMYLVK